jgi:hypothetical protein
MKSPRALALASASFAVGLLLVSLLALPAAQAGVVSSQGSIQSNFNAQSIAAGDTIWFSVVIQWVGNSPTTDTNVHFVGQSLTFEEPNGTTFTRAIYSSDVLFSTTAKNASTVWDAAAFMWVTTVPASYKGDVFLGGYADHVGPGGLPGSMKVTWAGTLGSSEKCVDFNWKWAAAVYTSFPATTSHPGRYSTIGVKPVDDNKLSAYQNSDHAGTPENETANLGTGGGTGGGGSNYTGSYSGTSSMNACQG